MSEPGRMPENEELDGPRRPVIVEDPERAIFKVRRSTMTSSSTFEEEQGRIFRKCWLYLGHESEIANPGDFKTRSVAGRSLLFCRDNSGRARAFLNTCPHRGAEVCREDEGTAKRFTCFYHGWTFSNDGRLLTLPDEESYGEAFDKSRLNLHEVPRVESYKQFVFVCFDPGVDDLVTYLAGARDYLDLVADQSPLGMEVIGGSQMYSIRANWKLLVENSMDGYHAATTHSTYLAYLKDLGTDLSPGITGVGKDLGNGHAVIEYKAPWGRPIAFWEPLWGEEARLELEQIRRELVERFGEERTHRMADLNRNLLIFPNLIINDIMSITIRTFYPFAPDYHTVAAWALGPIGEADHMRARRLDSFLTFLGPGGFATPDDVEALEICQRGFTTFPEVEWSDISRGMTREVPAATDELQMRAFWRRWNALMNGSGSQPARARTRDTELLGTT